MANDWDRDNDISLLEVFDITTGERKTLARFDYLIEAPNWTPDGKYLIYNSRGRLHRFDLEALTSTSIESGFANDCNNDHVLSPDGRQIAISHSQPGEWSRIYIIPMEGGEPRLVTPNAPSYLHGWNRGRLCYCAFRENSRDGDIFDISEDGGQERQLTFAPGLNDGPEYDPTGQYIWFNSVRTGLMQAWRMKADGSEQTQMTFDEDLNTWFPHVSPDGKKVCMLSYRKGDLLPHEHVPHRNVELRLMDADGSNLRTLTTLFGGQGTINVNSWSPDSTRFAFVSYILP